MWARRAVLVLGGTPEARAAAERLAAAEPVAPILAHPADAAAEVPLGAAPVGVVVRGPFRDAEGLLTAIAWDRIGAVLDASPPTDPAPSAAAEIAGRASGAPVVHLIRPPWPVSADQGQRTVPDAAALATILPFFARVLVAAPLETLSALRNRRDLWVLARAASAVQPRFPLARGDYAVGRPPFTHAHERILLSDHRISWVATPNAGGAIGRPLLNAAAERGAATALIARPPPPRGVVASTVDAALDALARARRRGW